MNPLISPPTDNLYKFVAIAGLALFAAGMILPIQVDLDVQKQLTPIQETLFKANDALSEEAARASNLRRKIEQLYPHFTKVPEPAVPKMGRKSSLERLADGEGVQVGPPPAVSAEPSGTPDVNPHFNRRTIHINEHFELVEVPAIYVGESDFRLRSKNREVIHGQIAVAQSRLIMANVTSDESLFVAIVKIENGWSDAKYKEVRDAELPKAIAAARAKEHGLIELLRGALISLVREEQLMDYSENVRKTSRIGVILGAALMFSGFLACWFHLQRWQDKSVRVETTPNFSTLDMPG